MLFILIFGELTWTFFDDPFHKIFSSLLIYMMCFTFLNCSNVLNSYCFNTCWKVHVIIDGLEHPLTAYRMHYHDTFQSYLEQWTLWLIFLWISSISKLETSKRYYSTILEIKIVGQLGKPPLTAISDYFWNHYWRT